MTLGWFRDHVLPGVLTWVATGGLVWVSHTRLWRRIKTLTAEQTRDLQGGSGKEEEHADG